MSDSKDPKNQVAVVASSTDPSPSDSSQSNENSAMEVTTAPQETSENESPAEQIDEKKKSFWAYFQTKEFYITLVLG